MRLWLVVAVVCGCSKPDPAPTTTTASSTAAPPLAFDVEGFCEKTMAVGRTCEGDDELMEGNKIGLCTTTLRAARDDDGVKLDDAAAKKCIGEVKAADPPLPDVRTLKTLAQRFESCRSFTKSVKSLSAVEAVPLGSAKEGEPCDKGCGHGLFCDKKTCAKQKPTGEACKGNNECVGRCSRKDGHKCAPYCGKG